MAATGKKRKLSEKQKLFVQEYLVDLNATQAAIRAKYKEKTAEQIGYQLLQKTLVQAAIQKAMDDRAKRTEITQDYVLDVIKDTVERCRQAVPVLDKKGEQVMVQTPTGEVTPAYTFMPMAVLKGTEQLGKHLKMFTDKVEHGFDLDNIFSGLDPDDAAALKKKIVEIATTRK